MHNSDWLEDTSPAFRLTMATSWLAPNALRENQEDAIRRALATGPDWAEYLRLVNRHQVTALSWAAISRTPGVQVPQPALQQLQELGDACRVRATQQCLLLIEALRGLNRVDIPVMPLKGPVLSWALYGDVGYRQSSDLDVAVAKGDLQRAAECLESLGWRADANYSQLSPRQRECFFQMEHHVSFVHSGTGRCLELHWRNYWETPENTRAWWDRSTRSTWRGCSIRSMSPGDLTLYLCRHGGKDAWSSAKLLGDLARADCLGLLHWEAAFEEARRSDQESTLLAGMYLLEIVYGLSLPQTGRTARRSEASRVTAFPLQLLKCSQGSPLGTGLSSLRNTLLMNHYEHKLCPRHTLMKRLSELFYCCEDFRTFPLPDRLFWIYKPLRPILWLRRWMRQKRHEPFQRRSGGVSTIV